MRLEESVGFRAGKEHQHEQPEIVEQVERGFLLCGRNAKLKEVRVSRPFPQYEWSQNAAGQNFSNHTRLPQACKQIAQQVRAGEQNREKKNEWADGAGRHEVRESRAAVKRFR